MSTLHEHELLEQARSGDQAALGDLLRAYQGRVYNVCLRMVSHRDDAAELTQDVLLKVCQHLGDYNGQAELGTWITRIAMNQSISHLRKRKLRRTTSLDAGQGAGGDADGGAGPLRSRWADDREPGPASRVEQEEGLGRLRRAIAELEDDFRAVLVLRDIEEMEYQQVAEVLALPLGTVKSRLFRARLALREKMGVSVSANADTPEGTPEVTLGDG